MKTHTREKNAFFSIHHHPSIKPMMQRTINCRNEVRSTMTVSTRTVVSPSPSSVSGLVLLSTLVTAIIVTLSGKCIDAFTLTSTRTRTRIQKDASLHGLIRRQDGIGVGSRDCTEFGTGQKQSMFQSQTRLYMSSDYLDGMKTTWDGDDEGDGNNSDEKDEGSSTSSSSSNDYLDPLKTKWEEEEDGTANGASTNAAATPSEDYTKLIQKLLITASSTDRGQFASEEQKSKMEEIITQLESSKFSSSLSIAQPTESPSIEGTWELLYSSTQLFRSSPFFMAGRAVCRTPEEAQQYDWFCDMHRAALAISEIGTVRQIISPNGRLVSEFEVHVGSVPFLSDFTPLKYSGGLPFTVTGAIVSSADITPVQNGGAWEIFMDTVEIKGSNIPLLRRALDGGLKLESRSLGSFLEENVEEYSNPKPIFETTYLDDTLRISRDQDGKVFVYGKMSDETEPTNYKSVDADLGLLNLLEGLNDNFFKFSI